MTCFDIGLTQVEFLVKEHQSEKTHITNRQKTHFPDQHQLYKGQECSPVLHKIPQKLQKPYTENLRKTDNFFQAQINKPNDDYRCETTEWSQEFYISLRYCCEWTRIQPTIKHWIINASFSTGGKCNSNATATHPKPPTWKQSFLQKNQFLISAEKNSTVY